MSFNRQKRFSYLIKYLQFHRIVNSWFRFNYINLSFWIYAGHKHFDRSTESMAQHSVCCSIEKNIGKLLANSFQWKSHRVFSSQNVKSNINRLARVQLIECENICHGIFSFCCSHSFIPIERNTQNSK